MGAVDEPGNNQKDKKKKKNPTGLEIYSSVSRQQENLNKLRRKPEFGVSCMDTVAAAESHRLLYLSALKQPSPLQGCWCPRY